MVKRFRSTGKWTAAYIETAGEAGPGNLPYLVASSADKVSLMPEGEINLIGVAMREMFARGFFDWIGVRPDFDAIGQYKTAANVFTQKDFTPAQKEEDNALVGDMFDQITAQVAQERGLKVDTVKALVDQAPLNAKTSLKDHLVDRLEYKDQFEDRLKHHGGGNHDLLGYAKYEAPYLLPSLHHPPEIAVIYGVGAITRGRSGFDPILSPEGSSMGSDDIVAAFKEARKDDHVRAVVFRVDSPGGSVIASELIRREVALTAAKKPVVVSMSGYGASGGYWVSTAAARIIADPGTITGSIGVLGGKFNIAGGAAKLGINSGAVTRGQNVEMLDAFTDFTPAQEKIFRDQILGETYQHFLKLVAAHTHQTVEQVDQIAQGRVWTGRQAFGVKLVDSLGSLDDALGVATRMAKLPAGVRIHVKELPEIPGPLEQLLGQFDPPASASLGLPVKALRPFIRVLRAALARQGAFGQAYCPVRPIL